MLALSLILMIHTCLLVISLEVAGICLEGIDEHEEDASITKHMPEIGPVTDQTQEEVET